MVVSESVLIQPPYTLNDIKAPSDKADAETLVRKIVDRHYQRKKGNGGVPASARAPVAVPSAAPHIPNAPRKGG
jgi:hypothetical protein